MTTNSENNFFVREYQRVMLRNPRWGVEDKMWYHELFWGVPMGPVISMLGFDLQLQRNFSNYVSPLFRYGPDGSDLP